MDTLDNIKSILIGQLLTLQAMREFECEKNNRYCTKCIFHDAQEVYGCQPDDILVWLAEEVSKESRDSTS